jgi:hypothetical protein
MVFIYVLQLEDNSGGYKYYIGKTNNPNRRLLEHCNSEGSSWTKMYKPIKVVTIIQDCSHFDEDKYTLEYMSIHGIDNVRGGSFCSVFLSLDVKIMIERMIRGSTDKCFKCGKSGHFSSNCDNKENKKPYEKLLQNRRIIKPRIKQIESNSNYNTSTTSQIQNYKNQLSVSFPVTTPIPELIKVFNLPVTNQIPELIKVFNLSVPELIKIF